ncbi:hypothetical protein [Streptomyces sp. NPDC051001]|uniref:hypothetical protein n=1 Tax=Streptomyces sp. NPDC051001 TaxID=3155795 RepID=UPI003417AA50
MGLQSSMSYQKASTFMSARMPHRSASPGSRLGYAVVAEELLESDYDGPSRLPSHVQRPTWWDRFFGFF